MGSVFAFASKLRCHRASSAVAELGFADAEDLMVEVSLDATAEAELAALLLLLLLLLLLEVALAGCSSAASHRMGGFKKAAM